MKRQGYLEVFVRLLRSAFLIDASLALVVGLISFALGLRTLEAYETLLIWAGMGLIVISCMIGAGGVASRMQDVTAFSLSRAGDMSENLKQIAESGKNSLGCFILLLVSGTGLLILGYLIPALFLLFES